MSRVAYFDCFSGASGDMILGALLDAGLSFDALRGEVAKLALPPGAFELKIARVQRAGFAATKLDVIVNEPPRHRSLAEVLDVVRRSTLPETDRERIEGVFSALGEAEARVHGSSVEAVELHEVGAVDALVDVTGRGRRAAPAGRTGRVRIAAAAGAWRDQAAGTACCRCPRRRRWSWSRGPGRRLSRARGRVASW